MRCLFCKASLSDSRSVEHILPESLGNRTFVLPRGVVCDRCNNYFSRKVEQPFLESPAVKQLRFSQSVPNKRGLIPPIAAIVDPGHVVNIYKHHERPLGAIIDVGDNGQALASLKDGGRLYFPADPAPPSDRQVSRFLAKAAFEALAHRLVTTNHDTTSLIDDPQFDPIREHARMGNPKDWPHFARRIYDPNRHFPNEHGSHEQTVWECDFLLTKNSELFFSIAIFGLELTINMGGPEIDGFTTWIDANGGASPLYRNKDPHLRP